MSSSWNLICQVHATEILLRNMLLDILCIMCWVQLIKWHKSYASARCASAHIGCFEIQSNS